MLMFLRVLHSYKIFFRTLHNFILVCCQEDCHFCTRIELMCLYGFSSLVSCQFVCVPHLHTVFLTLLIKCCPYGCSRRSVLTSAPFEMQAFQFMQLSLLVSLYNQLCLCKSTARIFPLVCACLFLLKGQEASLERVSCLPLQIL